MTTEDSLNVELSKNLNGNIRSNFSHSLDSDAVETITTLGFSLIIIITIGGNLLVLFAISTRHKLRRNVTNCLIASLAAADLILGAVVMPFAVIDLLRCIHKDHLPTEKQDDYILWPYGQDWCDIWHALDVLSSTASILNLCVISVERYIAISDPFNYPLRMTHSRCILMIMLTWICSILISFPAIAWWRYSNNMYNVTDINSIANGECLFSSDRVYLFLSSCISFHIPLIVMIVVYWKIYQKANGLIKTLTTGKRLIYRKSLGGEVMILRVHRGGTKKSLPPGLHRSILTKSFTNTDSSLCSKHSDIASVKHLSLPNPEENMVSEDLLDESNLTEEKKIVKRVKFNPPKSKNVSIEPSTQCTLFCGCYKIIFNRSNITQPITQSDEAISTTSGQNNNNNNNNTEEVGATSRSCLTEIKKRVQRFTKERKAAKTLGIVMGVFVLCWLPFFVYNTIKAIYPSVLKSNENIIFPLVTWLGYINSCVNPFIYAYSLRDIRKAFVDILCTPFKLHAKLCQVKRRRIRHHTISQYTDEPVDCSQSKNYPSTASHSNGTVYYADQTNCNERNSSVRLNECATENNTYQNNT
ncbi:unnamed protein product [Trichobilharzia szidati]|nr:unnamed protein product [Trichobilharzia szidati]